MALVGIGGKPYLNLEHYIDPALLVAVDDEITNGLPEVDVSYTGGSHKWMGIVPPSLAEDDYADYGRVLEAMSDTDFARFIELSDTPYRYRVEDRAEYTFGEEQDHPLSRRQMLFLKYKFGVYFPWKIFYQFIPVEYWDEKSTGDSKFIKREARQLFPLTCELIESLPFKEIGRCNLMGLEANDHGTVHRDGDPLEKTEVDHFITLCPRGNKRLFLWDEEERKGTPVEGRVYWFNDSDYHGVAAAPFFQYSLRVDGIFTPGFLDELLQKNATR